MAVPTEMVIRRAKVAEAERSARVMIAARHAAVPAIPPLVHSDTEVVSWFGDFVMKTHDVWVASVDSSIVAVMVLSGSWIEQLYVDPQNTNRGVGTALVAQAKSEGNDELHLWTFASNIGAQRFYERHGFIEIDRTDGENEEGEPDIRYRWSAE